MQKKNILFFTCFNLRSIQMESSIYYFQKKGYTVYFLTTCPKGALHAELERNGIVTDAIPPVSSSKVMYYIHLIRFLITHVKKYKIAFVHSHLQIPNLIASISRFFMKAEVFTVRHNSDVIWLNGTKKEQTIEKLINRFSKNIIAISDKVKEQLIIRENVPARKVHRINNGYDFAEYDKLSAGSDAFLAIKQQYPADLLIVSPGRLIKTKRHDLGIESFKTFKSKGFNIKLLILGDGPEQETLQKQIAEAGLTEMIFLAGYDEKISDYIKAADVVSLLSESEASNNTVKEAGYFEKTVIACENTGDFSDYIVNEKNGFLVDKQNPVPGFTHCIEQIYADKTRFTALGKSLKQTVLREFDIEAVGKKYEELQNEKH